METFMADFRLDDLGAIEFKEFGEETNVFIGCVANRRG
jgi:hypothetical protein